MTRTSSPSMMATQELVVPTSMPMTLAMGMLLLMIAEAGGTPAERYPRAGVDAGKAVDTRTMAGRSRRPLSVHVGVHACSTVPGG